MTEPSVIEASELRPGDRVRFPGEGDTKYWVPVVRVVYGWDQVEVLFAHGTQSEYKTFEADRKVMRLPRATRAPR